MNGDLYPIWVYLAETPLLGLTVTLLAYLGGTWIYRCSGQHPLLNPVLLAVSMVAVLLWVTGTSYRSYFDGAQFIHFLLGPATVALAVPLHRELARIRRVAVPVLAAVMLGSMTAIVSAAGIALALGASRETAISLAPKSATAPVAMSLSEQRRRPSLTAVLTGITGALVGRAVLNVVRIADWRARGVGFGVAAHGIATARALQVNPVAGAFSGLGFALNAIATAVLLPLGVALVTRLGG
jgi:predicted murein hydrolase (TIGR00659 family)